MNRTPMPSWVHFRTWARCCGVRFTSMGRHREFDRLRPKVPIGDIAPGHQLPGPHVRNGLSSSAERAVKNDDALCTIRHRASSQAW
jgi:hypothetical protein